ncbi:MAG: 2,3-bisphosphoglycerate-independent phosphoglycerate mutase, partial [Alphaproteobacteria bacterium]|nr:2,3-bisphosphoglycerate-independent phosphoglycerate mutase [Alphaproteobacteria bacterium]
PVILVNGPAAINGLRDGRLADVAPTLLELLKLEQPPEMTGVSLVDRAGGPRAATGEHVSA